MAEDRASSFLQLIRRSQRGHLKVYLGYGPGVGKTYQMLSEGQRLKGDGIDVVLGLVETHGRAETVKLVDGLEIVPRRRVEYHGIHLDEMDVDALLARGPQVALIDELAHTNVPGSKNAKRYQDVQDVLAAGIHVITTLNVQHLESLYNTVEQLVGVKVRERIPDSVLADADQIVNIDLAAEDLQKRLEQGKIYPRERVASSLANFFTASNLEHLRELTLREVASQLDLKRREIKSPTENGSPEQIMVCLSSRGPNSARLLRFGSRLAGRLNRNWYAVYVQTPAEEATVIDATTQRLLTDTLTLANQLGATVFTFKGQDVADTILRFAGEYRVGQVVIGRPRPVPWWRWVRGERSVAEQLIRVSKGVTVIVVDAEAEEPAPARAPAARANSPAAPARPAAAGVPSAAPPEQAPEPTALGGLLTGRRVLVWNDPMSKQDILRALVAAVAKDGVDLDVTSVLRRVAEREQLGSTFLNEGVALPHARLEELMKPQVALGLTRGGVLDAPTDRPVEAVFLLLSPAAGANVHLQVLAKVGRILQNRDIRRQLREVQTSAEAFDAITRSEQNAGVPTAASSLT